MSVYIDPMVNHGKRIGRAGPSWCHMIADTLDELHAMADRIGLRRSWFQGGGSLLHYDIGTERIRELAVGFGAVECDRAAFVVHMRRIQGRCECGARSGMPCRKGCAVDARRVTP